MSASVSVPARSTGPTRSRITEAPQARDSVAHSGFQSISPRAPERAADPGTDLQVLVVDAVDDERPYSLGGWTRDNHDWRGHAACASADPNLFFPVGVTGTALPQIDAAKVVCSHCSVRMACLDYAILTNQQYGVWGGCTEDERRAIRRRWRRVGVSRRSAVAG